MVEDIDWTQVGKVKQVKPEVIEPKKIAVEKETIAPPSETSPPPTSNEKSLKNQRNRQPKEDGLRHATNIEMEANLGQLRQEQNELRARFEEFLASPRYQLTPEVITKVQICIKAILNKHPSIFNVDVRQTANEVWEALFQ